MNRQHFVELCVEGHLSLKLRSFNLVYYPVCGKKNVINKVLTVKLFFFFTGGRDVVNVFFPFLVREQSYINQNSVSTDDRGVKQSV